jgi:hypothetical protein
MSLSYTPFSHPGVVSIFSKSPFNPLFFSVVYVHSQNLPGKREWFDLHFCVSLLGSSAVESVVYFINYPSDNLLSHSGLRPLPQTFQGKRGSGSTFTSAVLFRFPKTTQVKRGSTSISSENLYLLINYYITFIDSFPFILHHVCPSEISDLCSAAPWPAQKFSSSQLSIAGTEGNTARHG